MNKIFELLKNIIVKYIAKNSGVIKINSGLSCDLGIDSMTLQRILADAEKKFNITIFDEKIQKVETVNDLCDIIDNLIEEKGDD